MSIIKCPECNKEISNKALKCPNCGYPISENNKDYFNNNNFQNRLLKNSTILCPECNQEISNKSKRCPYCGNRIKVRDSFLSLLSLACTLLMCTLPLGAIFAIIDLWKSRGINSDKTKTHAGSKLSLIITVIVIGIFVLVGNNKDTKKETSTLSETITKSIEIQSDVLQETSTVENKDAVFQNGIIWQGNECIITLTGASKETLKFLIENNSSKDYSFNIHSLSVNGIMTDCNIYTMNTDIPSGKKSNVELDISEYTSEFSNFEYAEMLFWVYDNSKSYKDFETEIIHIESDKFSGQSYFYNSEKKCETNGLTVLLGGLQNDKFNVYICNNNDYYVDVDIENLSFNGWAYDTSYEFDLHDVEIFPNSQIKLEMDIEPEFLHINNIEEILNCEFSINIRKYGDYFDAAETEKIVFEK